MASFVGVPNVSSITVTTRRCADADTLVFMEPENPTGASQSPFFVFAPFRDKASFDCDYFATHWLESSFFFRASLHCFCVSCRGPHNVLRISARRAPRAVSCTAVDRRQAMAAVGVASVLSLFVPQEAQAGYSCVGCSPKEKAEMQKKREEVRLYSILWIAAILAAVFLPIKIFPGDNAMHGSRRSPSWGKNGSPADSNLCIIMFWKHRCHFAPFRPQRDSLSASKGPQRIRVRSPPLRDMTPSAGAQGEDCKAEGEWGLSGAGEELIGAVNELHIQLC